MDLILWRHAEAEDGRPDSGRKLTRKGRNQAAEMAAWLRARVREPWKVLASPLARAQETALALTSEAETIEALVTADAPALLEALSWPRAEGTVIAVGHQPVLGRTAALLLSGKSIDLSIKKSAVWWFRSREDHAVLIAVMTPEFCEQR